MKLIESYSKQTGCEISDPFIFQKPYPLPFDKYIVINVSSGHVGKNYAYWQDVVDLLHKQLKELNIYIVQLGAQDDQIINHCFNLQGKTDIHQSSYILNNSILFLGNDSLLSHVAGYLDIPSVLLYGPTSPDCHSPYWKNDKTILIESDRNGLLPSFIYEENPRTIDLIPVEKVVESIWSILGVDKFDNIETVNIGSRYNTNIIESVLDSIVPSAFLPNSILNIRYDFLQDVNMLARQVQERKCTVITDKVIDINLFAQLKHNITNVVYMVDENDNPDFAKAIKNLGIKISLCSKLDSQKLNIKKLGYFDIDPVFELTKFTKDSINKKELVTSNTHFKSKKILLSKGNFYLSQAHYLNDIPMASFNSNSMEILDVPKFYEELDYFYLFNKK